jgi:hypothetical protein
MPAKMQKSNRKPLRSNNPPTRVMRRSAVPRGLFVMSYPQAHRVRLVFPTAINITEAGAGVGSFRYFRLNSAYDVDTAVGSTVMPGFTEWSAFYSNYRVLSTAVDFTATVSGVSAGAMATICMVPNSSQPTLPSNPTVWSVQPQSVHQDILNYSSGGSNRVRFTRRYSLASLFRVTQTQFQADFDYSATTSANPARQAYLAFTVLGANSSTPATMYMQIYVSMMVEFFNPIQLST